MLASYNLVTVVVSAWIKSHNVMNSDSLIENVLLTNC